MVVLVKTSMYHVTNGVKRLFSQLLVSFYFLKSILDDAIVDIRMIFKFGLKTIFRYFLNSGCLYQWESRDSSATRIFF